MDSFDDLNDDLNHAMDVVAEQVAHNATRLDELITRLHDRLSRDYTHIPIILSSCMIIGGFFTTYFKDELIFSLTAMVWGALIFLLTLFFRHRISGNLTKFGESLVKLDQNRQDHARKIAVIENIIREGMPSNMSLNHLLALLGEYKNEHNADDGLTPDTRPENN